MSVEKTHLEIAAHHLRQASAELLLASEVLTDDTTRGELVGISATIESIEWLVGRYAQAAG
jgi:hypothetical protein